MQTYKKLLYLLSYNERKQGVILIFMFLLMAVLDIIGVASIMPFIYVLSNPEIIDTNSIINSIFQASNFIGIQDKQEFLFALGIFFFAMLVISLSFKALTTYVQTRFAQMRQFSSDASHELRTPLTVLKGQNELVLSKQRKLEEGRKTEFKRKTTCVGE